MIILLYFDWNGSRRELKEWKDKLTESCENTGIKYMGLYGSMNEKWNYVCMFETESYDKFLEMCRNVGRPPRMPHHISEILIPQRL